MQSEDDAGGAGREVIALPMHVDGGSLPDYLLHSDVLLQGIEARQWQIGDRFRSLFKVRRKRWGGPGVGES